MTSIPTQEAYEQTSTWGIDEVHDIEAMLGIDINDQGENE